MTPDDWVIPPEPDREPQVLRREVDGGVVGSLAPRLDLVRFLFERFKRLLLLKDRQGVVVESRPMPRSFRVPNNDVRLVFRHEAKSCINTPNGVVNRVADVLPIALFPVMSKLFRLEFSVVRELPRLPGVCGPRSDGSRDDRGDSEKQRPE